MKKILMLGVAASALLPARAFAALDFDATTVEPDTGFGEPVPPGWYNVAIDESDNKPTKDATGSYLALRFNILDGQYAGRKVFTNLNLKNSNAQTVEIAQRQLSAICHAVGVLRPQDSTELHGKPLKIKVKIRPGTGTYSESNDITSYKNINEAVDAAGGDAAAGAAAFGAAPGAGGPANPWDTGAAANLAAPPAAQPPAAEPAAPPPATPEPAPVLDPLAKAEADGWIKHPTSPGWHYKGQEVVKTDELAARAEYAAPPAEPAAPPAPAAPAAPVAPAADPAAAGAAPPPWAKPPA